MEHERLRVESDGLGLAAQIFAPAEPGRHPLLCICHGLPQGPHDPADRGYQVLAERFASQGFLTIIFNFRGAGESEGNMDMPGWRRDLAAVLDKAVTLPSADPSRVNLLGFSAGAAVSIVQAACDTRVTAVASCASPARFTFLREEAAARQFLTHLRAIRLIRDPSFPPDLAEWMKGWDRTSPVESVAGIAPRPLLLMHGDRDEAVPLKNAHMLYDSAGEPKQLLILPGAGHRLRLEPSAMEAVEQWLKSVNDMPAQ